jgi:hypothetical protein
VANRLREMLDEDAGWQDFQMVIPAPFLPPRFQELSNGRNMILLLDRDLTLHVRWVGARMHEHRPLTPGGARRLVREVLNRMTKYRRDLQVFARFVDQEAEQPFDDPRFPDPIRISDKRELPPASKIEEDGAVEISASVSEIREQLEAEHLVEAGGESPMPTAEEFYE